MRILTKNKKIFKKKKELKNTIIEVKNTLEGINRRLVDTEKHSNLEDRLINITQSEQQNEERSTHARRV